MAAFGDANQAIRLIPSLDGLEYPEATMELLVEMYRHAFQAVWVTMTVLSGLGLIASLFMKELTMEREDVR
ncbi:hypothetical protein F5Y17DRAFT_456733 [Xylariaceae sp. FL0594]|nr:hypothetical protein F5Y17DRAFT_456733 [Xylariaceae sp. FL0594]